MLTVLGGLGRIRARTYPRPHWRRPRTGEGERREDGAEAEAYRSPEARGDPAARIMATRRLPRLAELQRVRLDDFEAHRTHEHEGSRARHRIALMQTIGVDEPQARNRPRHACEY